METVVYTSSNRRHAYDFLSTGIAGSALGPSSSSSTRSGSWSGFDLPASIRITLGNVEDFPVEVREDGRIWFALASMAEPSIVGQSPGRTSRKGAFDDW